MALLQAHAIVLKWTPVDPAVRFLESPWRWQIFLPELMKLAGTGPSLLGPQHGLSGLLVKPGSSG